MATDIIKQIKDTFRIPEEIYIPSESVMLPLWSLLNKDHKGKTVDEINFKNGFVKIENNSLDYKGLPSIVDFEIYLKLMILSNRLRKENNNFPMEVEFKLKDLRKSLKYKDKGGKLNQDLIDSLNRLQVTNIITNVKIGKNNNFVNHAFSLLYDVKILKPGKEYFVKVIFNPDLVFKQPYVTKTDQSSVMIDGKKIKALTVPSSNLIYIRLQKHIKRKENIRRGFFTLTYNLVLNEILTGMKKYSYLSEVKRQVEHIFNDLIKGNVIQGYTVYKNQKRDKTGKKLSVEKEDGEIRIDFHLHKSLLCLPKPVKQALLKGNPQPETNINIMDIYHKEIEELNKKKNQ